MKKLILILCCHITAQLYCQTTITGKVVNFKGKPINAVNITIKDSYDGANTDSAGMYSLTTDEVGDKIMVISIVNYRTVTKNITLNNTAQVIDVVLKEMVNESKAVVVTAGTFEASDKKRLTVLTSLDIVTTASANADVTGALKTLPGAQTVGESEGLFVRGGTATESKIFIDGTQVNNFFYSAQPGIASRGRFNPFLFKGTSFSTGGYSALYGQALSSALILESIDLPDQSSANYGISLVGASAGYQGLAKNNKSSYGFTFNHTNLAVAFGLIKQQQEFTKTPTFNDADANFRIKTSKTGVLKYYGYYSSGNLANRVPDLDSNKLYNAFTLKNNNTYHNLSYKERLGKGWRLQAGLSYSTNKDALINELQNKTKTREVVSSPTFYLFKNNKINTNNRYLQNRLVMEKKLPGINALRFGTETSVTREITTFTLFNNQKFTDTVTETLNALFAETDLYITNDLALKVGGRAEYSQQLNRTNLAPRLALAYKVATDAQLSFASGTFYQNPDRRYMPTAVAIGYSKATHYILQYFKNNANYSLRGEVFYKKYNALYKTGASNTKEVVLNNNGSGYAQGVELFWRDRKTVKGLDYWFSYSYLDTRREFNNYPTQLEPTFAAKHTASLVAKKFVLKWKTGFNASYTFATGRPYYNFVTNNFTGFTTIADRGRSINYNSLSLSLNYLPKLGKPKAKSFIVLVASVSNVLGSNQVFTYNYNQAGEKFAVTPPARRFAFIGCFVSIGVDRTQDAINGNL